MSVFGGSGRGGGVFRAVAGGVGLAASATSFLVNLANGGVVATIRNPFPGATVFAPIGAVPAQLAVSAEGVVTRTGTAAVAGATYSVKIRATSADGAREIAITFIFRCVDVVVPTLSGVIPDIVEGASGSVDLEITAGVTPLALSAIVKPAWMTVAIVGAAVRVTWTNASLSG